MASAEPEAAEQAPSLVDVLQQLELPAADSLVDKLACYRCISRLRLTCRALRDLADPSVRIRSRGLTIQLRENGTVTEPLAALERWSHRDGIELFIELPAEAPDGVDALLPAAFTQLPDAVRRRVSQIWVFRSSDAGAAFDKPAVLGAAVGALAASLPCLRRLNLSFLSSTWTPGGSGEAYAALAALGTLEELELPGIPGLTGVEALAGSLRSLKLVGGFERYRSLPQVLTRQAAAPLAQLTRLETLDITMPEVYLGEGPILRNLLSLLPRSLRVLKVALQRRVLSLNRRNWAAPLPPGLDGTFGVTDGRLVSAELGELRLPRLAALAREELLPCLGPDGRLESLRVKEANANGWGSADVTPLVELWHRSGEARVDQLAVKEVSIGADVCSALAALGTVHALRLVSQVPLPASPLSIRVAMPPQPVACWAVFLEDLPPPEEVLRMALQRIAPPGAGGVGGAVGGGWSAVADAEENECQLLLLRGPAAAAALAQPSSQAAVKAWTRSLEERTRAAAGVALGISYVRFAQLLPPASAVLVGSRWHRGAAEAVATAVAEAWAGTEVALVRGPGLRGDDALEWGLGEVMSELWAASCAGEGGPGLEQRVEWAIAVLELINSLPHNVSPSD